MSLRPEIFVTPVKYYPDGKVNPATLHESDHFAGTDFQGRSYDVVWTLTNQIAQKTMHELSPSEVTKFLDWAYGQFEQFESYVHDASNYPKEAAERIKTRHDLADTAASIFLEALDERERNYYIQRYQIEADRLEDVMRMIFRKAQSQESNYITDMDDSMTSNADYYLHNIIPGGETAEALIDQHHNTPQAILEALPQTRLHFLLDDQFSKLYRIANRDERITIRPGVDDFFRYAGHVTVLSASFRPSVEGVLDRLQSVHSKDTEVVIYAVDADSVISLRKDLAVSHSAKRNPDAVTVFIGDGGSDFVVTESEEVGYIYAIRGKSLHKKLNKGSTYNTPFLPVDDYEDILHIEQLLEEDAEMFAPYFANKTSGHTIQ